MRKMERVYTLLFLIGFGILLTIVTYIRLEPNHNPITKKSIPEWDPSKEPFFFNFQTEEWVYKGDRTSRANESFESTVKPEDTDEILQRKIPGYKKNTYWGEEYEFEDDYEFEDEEYGFEDDYH